MTDKFTEKEIELCRKIAEKERREIKCGDWIIPHSYEGQPSIILRVEPDDKHYAFTPDDKKGEHYILGFLDMNFPLWQEHDCLEWLREKGFLEKDWCIENERDEDGELTGKILFYYFIPNTQKTKWWTGDTILEALLRAILAILEER